MRQGDTLSPMTTPKAAKRPEDDFFAVRVTSIPTDIPLPYDLYLWIDNHAVRFRSIGDVLTGGRLSRLITDGLRQFYVPYEQRPQYMAALRDQIRHPVQKIEVRARYIKESAFVHVQNLFTNSNLSEALSDSKTFVEDLVNFISADMEAATSLMRLSHHDYYTYNHSVNVAVYAIALARKIYGNDKLILMTAGFGGLLHDIGKRKIDLGIINKEGALTEHEWEEMRRHPTYGMDFLKAYANIPEDSKKIVYEHHESFDGSGYPQGLKEDQISELARVTTIADVFDALTTARSYRGAMPPDEALQTMYSMQPGKFDPSLFRTFDKNFTKRAKMELEPDFDPCQTQPTPKRKKQA